MIKIRNLLITNRLFFLIGLIAIEIIGIGCAEIKSYPSKLFSAIVCVETMGLAIAKITNGNGQEVRTLWNNRAINPGPLTITWEGNDANGKFVPPGVYSLSVSIQRVELKPITKFGGLGSTPGRFLDPQGLCAYPQGARLTVAVADTGNQRVQVLTDTGGFLLAAGQYGAGDGTLDQPSGVAWDGQFLTVCDSHNRRLARFDERGNYLSEIRALTGLQTSVSNKVTLDFQNPAFIQKGGGDDFWVADTGYGILFHITDTGGVLEELGNPFHLNLDGPFIRMGGGFWVRSAKDQIQVLGGSGETDETLKMDPPFQSVEGMAAQGEDIVLTSDSAQDLLYFFDKDGRVFETLSPPLVSKPTALSIWQDHLFMIDASTHEVFHFQLVSKPFSELTGTFTVNAQ